MEGVVYCEQYEKLDGNYYANFIRRNFQNMFQKSEKCSKLFVQDNCPILNCARARKALKEVGGELFPIPKRSGDLNPIENVFNVAKEELQTQAITFNLTYESFEDFARRVKGEAIRVINWDEFVFFFVMVVANCNESCYWLHVHSSQWQLLLFFHPESRLQLSQYGGFHAVSLDTAWRDAQTLNLLRNVSIFYA